jgi:hypothetical protein
VVERVPDKNEALGSIPSVRTKVNKIWRGEVEHFTDNKKVPGPIPGTRTPVEVDQCI